MDAKTLIKHYEGKKSDRSLFDSQWEEIGKYIVPHRQNIITQLAAGQKLTSSLYDSTAYDANIILALWLSGSLTSMASQWFSLKVGGDSDEDEVDQDGKVWLDTQKKKLFSALRASNFSSQIDAGYIDWGSTGNLLLFGDEKRIQRPGFNGFHFECIAPGTYVIDEDDEGSTVFVGREYKLSANAAVSKWGEAVGEKILNAAEKETVELFTFLHLVYPREWFGNTKKTHPFISDHINYAEKKIVTRGGYEEMPFFFIPYLRVAGEKYGRGPGHIALPDARTLNMAEQYAMKGWAKELDPAVEILEAGIAGAISLIPGSKNIVTQKGTITPIQTGIRWDVNQIEREQKRESIRRIFHNDKIMVLPDPKRKTGDMTAFEVSIRYEMAQKLLGSPFNNLTTYGFDKIIERCFAIMQRAGALDPAPPSILRLAQRDGRIDIEYESPLARAQRLEQVESMNKLFGFIGQFSAEKPEVWDNVDVDEGIRVAGGIMGTPPKVLRSKEGLATFRQKKEEARAEAQEMEAAQAGAEVMSKALPALKDLPPEMAGKMAEMAGRSGMA